MSGGHHQIRLLTVLGMKNRVRLRSWAQLDLHPSCATCRLGNHQPFTYCLGPPVKGVKPDLGEVSHVLSVPGVEKILHKPRARCLPSWWPESMKLDLVSSWLFHFLQDTVSGLFQVIHSKQDAGGTLSAEQAGVPIQGLWPR